MYRLRDEFQVQRRKNRLPQRALELFDKRAGPPGKRIVAILEEGDDIGRVPRELGRHGLLEIIDCEWRSYECIVSFIEGTVRWFEMVIRLNGDDRFHLLIPDADWIDQRLRLVLDVEADTTDPNLTAQGEPHAVTRLHQ